ncbi:gluconate 2-dehydrogenase subunit 3 family protein [Larsenimonas salina]|uniref:gluconate 2-dehydrogenase subunit 3 family protein n=1 Tax=Larsenimonas salina TaxID=1295565 RepID=UPI002073807E|nr:gluconate 2-dehydrogenase subunit 3 family protein [Larsenimonas salina]MCM5704441.1 gluconate 2-dehydrogenase subunit 3 family protein [Larsenimonas salina]
MTDQPNNWQRRTFMRQSFLTIPAISAVASVPLSAWAQDDTPPLSEYYPRFFEPQEWAFILAATDRLIPADDNGPGAIAAHVPVFIDQELAGDYGNASDWYMDGPFLSDLPAEFGYQLPHTPAAVYRLGIKATHVYCQRQYGTSFAALDKAQQITVLEALEAGEIDFNALGVADLPSQSFFAFLLQNTKEGFFADPIYGGNRHMAGWKLLGFPGARANFLEWVDQYDRPYPLGPVSLKGLQNR